MRSAASHFILFLYLFVYTEVRAQYSWDFTWGLELSLLFQQYTAPSWVTWLCPLLIRLCSLSSWPCSFVPGVWLLIATGGPNTGLLCSVSPSHNFPVLPMASLAPIREECVGGGEYNWRWRRRSGLSFLLLNYFCHMLLQLSFLVRCCKWQGSCWQHRCWKCP